MTTVLYPLLLLSIKRRKNVRNVRNVRKLVVARFYVQTFSKEITSATSAAFDPTLEALCLNLSPEDADELRQERAGILEFEGGLTRAEAERRAGLSPSSRSHTPLPGIEIKGVKP